MNKSLNSLHCAVCGSSNVEVRMWVNPNNKAIGDRCSDSSEEEDNWCITCEEHVELLTLPELWRNFGDIAVNENDEIENDFMQFPAGTSKFDVWHWFDERCPNNLHDDLMFPSNKK